MKKVLLVLFVLVVVASLAQAGNVNRWRGTEVGATSDTTIGTCEPETDGTAAGWDTMPPGGSWGGQATSTFAVAWQKGAQDIPTNEGRMAECTISGVTGKTPGKVEIKYLHGLANDDFCVFASISGNELVLVGCENETNTGGESWMPLLTMDLPLMSAGQDVRIVILATGNAWTAFSTYGQLAVDYIKITE